ncbi:peptide deformylase [Mycoplasma phocoenae]|uniref:Peptide deformylase n=1 Tax=Mycoplasma phocoenae TaxID=754517 RepID=A0A858U7Z3_9MOLU|nr:peptide deformylase [Mycoplasma phocoenae]QJG66888.1 peptide deformylase [Mycoplasma phocoenae]
MYEIKLTKLPEKVLREKSKDVPIPLTKDDEDLIHKMIYHIDDSQKEGSKFRAGVGVAAVQYGILKNIFYINVPDEEGNVVFRDALVNPKLIGHSEAKVAINIGEGCLSVRESWKNQEGYVKRYNRVIVEAYSYFQKKKVVYDVKGYIAIVMQHEYDHLQGKLFLDHINQKNPWQREPNLILIGEGE